MRNSLLCMSLAAAALHGCTRDSPQDQFALRDAYRQLEPMPECEREIQWIESRSLVVRPHRTIGKLSATCSPGSPRVCKQTLMKRACELEADALLIEDSRAAGGNWQGGANFRLAPMNVEALRWTD